MEIGVAGETIIGGDVLEVDDENDGSVLEADRCGICMEVVIDRGVLDCCQDWFCFECIDNWGTITNLCPLCQGEFQMITCLPVYDTIRSIKVDEDLLREEDWSIEGTTNTLSFPSYYIDENAVSCLDGDDCKIRSGSATLEEDPNLDMSIACDSCDLWYHAFCVGFDLECTSEDTWLCPRCVADETRQKSDVASLHPIDDSSISSECLAETSLSGKVSISVADTGETAVVVSLVGGYQQSEGPCEDLTSTVDVENDLKNGTFFLSKEMSVIQPNLEAHDPELALNCVENVLTDGTKNQETREQHQHTPSDIPFSSVGKAEPDVNEDAVAVLGVKRNRTEHSSNIPSPTEDRAKKPRIETAVSTKKVRLQETNQMIPSEVQANNEDGKLRNNRDTEDAASDILSIVKGTHNKPLKGHTHRNLHDKVYKEKENESGLRVKKIMRRASDDKESSVLVQKLREQIREAVRNKSSAALGKNLFDPKLLAAFRGAVSRPMMDPVKKLSPSVIKVKKSILQKGKIRENLTKKIYATSRGRRRHGWDRDWEVEFWKHRCVQTVKPEKIDTLKSVLTLLRKGTDIVETEQSKEEGTNPILSRLYLADASVFPRKNDIKPLSAFKADGSLEYNGEDIPNTAIKVAEKNKVLSRDVIPLLSNEGSNSNLPSLKGKATSSKVHTYPHGSFVSVPGTSGANLQKETAGKSDNKKIDKKKWALEVLARKTATVGNRMAPEKQDLALVKGNYPLLAQLPIDMRPVLATSRHNKIPTSVRQAQLYRLAENFLKKADLPVLSRTAATELAIVDAINIEKEVADKSSSKIVYMNLCSQELLHRAENSKSTKAAAPKPPLPTISEDGSKQVSNEDSTDPAVEEALKAAGLLSDSPLGSPVNEMKGLDSHASTNIIEEGPDNVLEIDSNPDLDIYGDFEYDLEDEDYIGVSTVRLAAQQEGDPKMKLVLSTLNLNGSDDVRRGPENGFTNNPSLALETVREEGEDPSLVHHVEPSPIECEELYGPDKEPLIQKFPEMASRKLRGAVAPEALTKSIVPEGNCCKQNLEVNLTGITTSSGENSPNHSQTADNVLKDKKASYIEMDKKSDGKSSVQKKVELYIKEHIRPLCKSGVISTEHYRWAVAKTTEKVMKYHSKEKNANFLIKEGEKVKKLAEQYVEASQHKNRN